MAPGEDPQEPHRVKPSRRRDKPQLSCNLCRAKKLKCDRKQPCTNCEKRPLGSCVYPSSGLKPKSNLSVQPPNISVHDRIKRLEQLVTSLADTPKRKASTAINFKEPVKPETSRSPVESADHLSVDDTETKYLTPSHWEAILDDISELKDALAEDDSTGSEGNSNYPVLLFGERKPTSALDIICTMPPKSVFDEALTLFIRSSDVPTFSFHIPSFLQEYEEFWKDPTNSKVSLPWLACLLLVVAFTLQFQIRAGLVITGLISPEHTANTLTDRAADLLILSDYTRPAKYTVQAMIMYMASEYFRTESDFKVSLLFSILHRVAVRAGYHRDPSHYAQISVFEGERRRQIWALVNHFDLVVAFACGQPPLIDERADVRDPGNYVDEDLNPSMTELPPPRPDTEQTWIGYLNFKLKALRMLAKVIDRTDYHLKSTYEEVLTLDNEVGELLLSRPQWLQIPNAKALSNLTPSAISRLCFVDLIASRARLILHRRFLIAARKDEAFHYSRQVCLTAATSTLAYQNELHSLSQNPDGLLTGNWRFFILMAHDFVLAAMILCVDLDQDLLLCEGNLSNLPQEEQQAITERADLIEKSYSIWTVAFSSSADARKASVVLKTIVEKVRRAQAVSVSSMTPASTIDGGISTNETWNIPFPSPAPMTENMGIPFAGMNGDIAMLADGTPISVAGQVLPMPQTLGGLLSDGLDINLDLATPMVREQDFNWADWDRCFSGSAMQI